MGVQLELNRGTVAEYDCTETCRVTRHLELVDDVVDELENLRETLPANAARRVENEHDVQLAAASWMDIIGYALVFGLCEAL